MSGDYASILKKSWDEIPPVKVLPTGSWLLRGQNATYQEGKGDNSPTVLFVYKAKEPMDDVSSEEMDALGDNYDVSANRIFVRFFISDNSDWDKVRKHLAKHGIDAKGEIGDSLKAFKGSEVVAYLGTRTYTDNAGEEHEDNTASSFTPLE